MKTISYIFKIILFVFTSLIGLSIILLNSTFGNYTATVYDLFLNPFLFLIYFILCLIFIGWTKTHIKQKYYYLFLIPLAFTFMSYLCKQNFQKNIYLQAIMENSKGSLITLFDNNTFEIKVQHQHGVDYIKGNYEKKGNEIFLNDSNIINLTDSLFTQKYYILKDKKLIVSNNKNFKPLTMSYPKIR